MTRNIHIERPSYLRVVLENSNIGIESARASGAYIIGYRGDLVEGYEQTGADAYADTMNDVIKLVAQNMC